MIKNTLTVLYLGLGVWQVFKLSDNFPSGYLYEGCLLSDQQVNFYETEKGITVRIMQGKVAVRNTSKG